MKIIKLISLCFITAIVMAVSWAIGSTLGNLLTQSAPPELPAESNVGQIFLAVCFFNSIMIVILIAITDAYTGSVRRIALISHVFVIQFLLTQLETFFFAQGIGIGNAQTTAILIGGLISTTVTMVIAMIVYDKILHKNVPHNPLILSFTFSNSSLPILAFLVIVGYPFLYLTFGYYVAWRSESLRLFYTSSSAIDPYFQQTAKAFYNGIYFFQIFRGLIWILITIPLVVMLQGRVVRQYLVVAICSSLLPASLLFIPNPYMPSDISMVHFIETSTSNFLWGLLMVWGIKQSLAV